MNQKQITADYMGKLVDVRLNEGMGIVELHLNARHPNIPESYPVQNIVFLGGFPLRVDIGDGETMETVACVDADLSVYRFGAGANLTPDQIAGVIVEGWRTLLGLSPQLPRELQSLIHLPIK